VAKDEEGVAALVEDTVLHRHRLVSVLATIDCRRW